MAGGVKFGFTRRRKDAKMIGQGIQFLSEAGGRRPVMNGAGTRRGSATVGDAEWGARVVIRQTKQKARKPSDHDPRGASIEYSFVTR